MGHIDIIEFLADLFNLIGFLLLLNINRILTEWYFQTFLHGKKHVDKWNWLDKWMWNDGVLRGDTVKFDFWSVSRVPIGTLLVFIGAILSLVPR